MAFHCQQAAEKYLKALLVAVGVEPRVLMIWGSFTTALATDTQR